MNYTCRYDSGHTEVYSNAIGLQKHYIEAHSDVYVPPIKVPCPKCGKMISENSIGEHTKRVHGAEQRAPEQRNGKSKAVVPVKRARERVPWHPDQIVIPVISELVGNAVPITKLPVLFRWHAATAQMLEELQ